MSHIPNGDYRGVAMFSGTYPPRWWKQLKITLAWIGAFAVAILILWAVDRLGLALVR